MKDIRKQIDGIDRILIKILSRRMELAMELGKSKKKEGLPIPDKEREKEVLAKMEKAAKKEGLNPLFVKKLYNEILKESRRMQSEEI